MSLLNADTAATCDNIQEIHFQLAYHVIVGLVKNDFGKKENKII